MQMPPLRAGTAERLTNAGLKFLAAADRTDRGSSASLGHAERLVARGIADVDRAIADPALPSWARSGLTFSRDDLRTAADDIGARRVHAHVREGIHDLARDEGVSTSMSDAFAAGLTIAEDAHREGYPSTASLEAHGFSVGVVGDYLPARRNTLATVARRELSATPDPTSMAVAFGQAVD